MLKKSLLIALSALLAQGALADVLSPEEALQRANAQKSGRKQISALAQPKLAYTAKTEKGQAAVYVFNEADGGSVILSASDRAIPMLGYTDSGSFDPNNIPPQMQYWLNEYAAQIEYAEENNLAPVTSFDVRVSYPSSWEFIAPLVKTKWDQGRPYNQDLKSSAYATGCVATAMAQIMNYHKYPERAVGSVSYTDAYGNSYSMNLGEKAFDWANMIDDYSGSYTAEQASAVAYLMKACGYAAKMTYGSASGTQVESGAFALVTNFDYDGRLEVLQRYNKTNTEWATIIYNQLKDVGPVLYSGHSLGNMAHAFVCDGYDGQGYFHINWGWSGLCDGYYSLDALNPTVQGTGGSNYGGFNFSQGIVTNIMPSQGASQFSPEAEFTLLGNMSGTNVGSVLTLTMTEANPGNLVNSSMVAFTPVFAIYMENTENGRSAYSEVSGTYFNGEQFSLPQFGPGSFIDPQFSVRARFDSSLPDGKYKVQLVWRDRNEKDWRNFITANGCHDYVYVTKDGSDYTVESLPMEYFTIESAEIITPLYMRNPCQIQFTVTNPYDIELSQSIVPVLLYGEDRKLSFEGDSQLITVGPKETKTVVTTYTFSSVSGGTSPTLSTPRDYILGAYDFNKLLDRYYQSGTFRESYYGDLGTATMYRPASNASIQMRKIAIDNAEEEGMVEGIGFMYGIGDPNHIELKVTIYGTTGFVASPLSAVVYEYEGGKNGSVVYEKNFENLIFVEEGDTSTESTVLSMRDFDPSKIYNVEVYYVMQNSRLGLGSIRFGASAAVDGIIAEGGLEVYYDGFNIRATSESGLASVVVYDLGGKTVAAPACGNSTSVSIDASSLAKGIYLVKAIDAKGNEKVAKVLRK